jgi:translation elongation factor EF-4
VALTMGRGVVTVDNPAKFPDVGEIEAIQEPWVKLGVVTPDRYIGALMELTTGRRGTFENMEYLDPQRVHMHFELPLAELIVDYYDQLKSRTRATPRWTTRSRAIARRTSPRSTSSSTASRSTRSASSSTAIAPSPRAGP